MIIWISVTIEVGLDIQESATLLDHVFYFLSIYTLVHIWLYLGQLCIRSHNWDASSSYRLFYTLLCNKLNFM
jgi:hypothetical protein